MEDARNNFLFAGDTTTRADGFAGDTRAHSRAGTSVKPSVAFADCAAGVLASPTARPTLLTVHSQRSRRLGRQGDASSVVGCQYNYSYVHSPLPDATCSSARSPAPPPAPRSISKYSLRPEPRPASPVLRYSHCMSPKGTLFHRVKRPEDFTRSREARGRSPALLGNKKGCVVSAQIIATPSIWKSHWAQGDRRNHHLGSYLSRITAPRKGLEFRILPVRKSPRSRNDSRAFLSASSFVAAWAASSWTSPVAAPYTCTTSLS